MYCGDETGSFIGEIASNTSRFGYGGEDAPKCIIPSYMYSDGTIPSSTLNLQRIQSHSLYPGKLKKLELELRGTQFNHLRKPTFEDVQPIFDVPPYSLYDNDCDPDSYLNDGIISNYEAWENSWLYAFDILRFWDFSKHTTGGSNIRKQRTKKNTNIMSESNYKPKSTMIPSLSLESDGVMGRSNKAIHPILAIDSGNTYFHRNSFMEESAEHSLHNFSNYNDLIRRKQREFMTEILFETINSPAAFIAPGPMLAAFANGRQTALVVDIGASGTRITPVVDGFLLESAQKRNGRGGEWLCAVQRRVLEKIIRFKNTNNNIDKLKEDSTNVYKPSDSIHPRYSLKKNSSRNFMLDEKKSKFQVHYPLNGVTKGTTFHRIAIRDVMHEMITNSHIKRISNYRDENWTVPFLYSPMEKIDFAKNIVSNSDKSLDNILFDSNHVDNKNMYLEAIKNKKISFEPKNTEKNSVIRDDILYELPDGTRVNLTKTQYGRDLCRLPELLFSINLPFLHKSKELIEDTEKFDPAKTTLKLFPMHYLAKNSLQAVLDADIRKELCNNIILSGGASLIPGLDQRFSVEMNDVVSSFYKCKIIASRNSIERRYANWIGGSILTSLGSFQQLWMSKDEYEEYGVQLALKRFP